MKYARFFLGLTLLVCFPALAQLTNVELALNAKSQILIGAALQTAQFVQTGGAADSIGSVTIGYYSSLDCTNNGGSVNFSGGTVWPLITNQIFGLNAQGIYNIISPDDFSSPSEVHSISVVFSVDASSSFATFTGSYCTNNGSNVDNSFCCIKNVTCDTANGVCTSSDTIAPQSFTM